MSPELEEIHALREDIRALTHAVQALTAALIEGDGPDTEDETAPAPITYMDGTAAPAPPASGSPCL